MCVAAEAEECTEPLQVLVRYFCGTDERCQMKSPVMGKFGSKNDWDKVANAAKIARKNIIEQYYAIGVMGKHSTSWYTFQSRAGYIVI